MNVASSASFHSKSFTHQPQCTNEELEGIISGFNSMRGTLAIITQDIGQVRTYVDHGEVESAQHGMGYLINMLGAMSLQFIQISNMLAEAEEARKMGLYEYKP